MRSAALLLFLCLATYALITDGQFATTTTSAPTNFNANAGPINPVGGLGGSAVCPSVIFTQSLSRDPTAIAPGVGSGSAIPHVFSWNVAGSVPGTTFQGIQFVDAHFSVNNEPTFNFKMNPTTANAWTLPGLQLQNGDKVMYWFTYSAIINGVPINCDTAQFAFTASANANTNGSGSPASTSTTAPGATTATPLAMNVQPLMMQPSFMPQFPSQFQTTTPQALTATAPPTPPAPQQPSFPQPSGVTSAVCPAVNWSWQLLPAANSNGANTMALVFVAHGPTNPATAMNSISSVDVHLVLNGAPQNIRMQPAGAPNTFATNLVIPNPNSASLTFYFTIAAAMNTGPVTCDTAQQTFNGQLTGGGNGAITPSSTGGGDANAPPSQALRGLQPPTVMTIPVVFQPFAAPTGGGSGAPSTPPQNPTEVGNFMDSQRQKLQNDFATNSQSAFSGTTPTGFQPPLQPNSAGNFPAPIFPSAAMSGVGGGACPAIEVNQQVTQQPDGSWNVMFFAGNTKVMGAVLQSIDLVNITLDGAVPTPMSRVNGLVWSFPVKKSLKAGDTIRFTFTYSALISGTATNCTTPQFVFAIAPNGQSAPGGQSAGATTPLQLAQLMQQIPVNQPPQPNQQMPFGVNQQNIVMQPLSSSAMDPSQNFAINSVAPNSLPPLPPTGNNNNGAGTQSVVCPAVAFTSAVSASSGGGTTLSFTATKALKGTLQNLNFVDLHLSIPGRPDVNGRMMQSNSSPLTWTYELPWIAGGQLPAGSAYYFTICTILSTAGSPSQRVDCDSAVTTVPGGSGTVAPASTTGGGSFLPQQPQPLMQQPSGLPTNTQFVIPPSNLPQQFAPQQPNMGLNPSGVLSGSGSTPSAVAGSSPCPSISWTYSVVPTANGQYKLVWTPGRALRPDATLSSISYVDAHYSVNAQPAVNANMKGVSSSSAGAPDSFEVPALVLKPGDVLAFYFTYSSVIASVATQCDTSVLQFVVPQSGTGAGALPNLPTGNNNLPPATASPLSTALPSLGAGGGMNINPPATAALSSPPPAISSVVPSGVVSGISGLINAANGGGANANVPQSVVCPAILFDKQILPLGNGNYQLVFIGNSATNPTANLQSLASVDAHYVIANSQQVNTRMVKSSTNPLSHSLTVAIPPGSIFAVYFTYSAQLSSGSNPVSCDTSVFSFSS